ncbi:glycylpeptide N-tetradecanoyltransferase [Savitreella phatthalungensis]
MASGDQASGGGKPSKVKKVLDKVRSSGKNDANGKGEDAPGSAASVVSNNLSLDPALGQRSLADLLKSLSASELLTGMAPGKNRKDMADYKFWSTQPVPRLDDQSQTSSDESGEGPIEMPTDSVPEEAVPLLGEFEWVTVDVEDPEELKEVYQLLSANYVEDSDASFRFNYSASFFNWALKSPGYVKEWHVGVRVRSSKRLVAFISGIPVRLRVRNHEIDSVEINFMCVHKKLRSKRLAPTLIKEVTRRCHAKGIWQAIYTAGVVLPTPISSCRYYHRSLDWQKLYEIGFSHLPQRSTKARQIQKYRLPESTSLKGLRPMEQKDVKQVGDLLRQMLKKFSICQIFSDEEVAHWLLSDPSLKPDERVVWAYVVEGTGGKVSDFVSFYSLPSTVIGNAKHSMLNAAYLFYYGSDLAFADGQQKAYEARLKNLMSDALILARQFEFDVFNALSLMDNPCFLDELLFGPGDGFLNFYLYNWRTKPIPGGLTSTGSLDKTNSEVGLPML